MKNFFSKLGYDIIPVMLGILIALFINDYAHEKREKNYVKSALQTMLLEHQQNRVEIGQLLPKHKIVIDTFKHYAKDENLRVATILGKLDGGIPGASISNSGWKALASANLHTSVDFEILSILSDIDVEIKSLYNKYHNLEQVLYPAIGASSVEAKYAILVVVSDMIHSQERLLEDIEKFELHIKSKYPEL